ncbi:hypothetical protein D9756_006801 [Leucocoprinus leucothites]|uniref:Nephrocystin 3-like N-terminal domain-containing protein n=1 Tax=Leucocoprinus leucothites TaxID=201217 RepID=A0A8H5G1Z2_9AGAR|nr:hypothetical protein D9756_006801 [Leucoagaricus leucothites]
MKSFQLPFNKSKNKQADGRTPKTQKPSPDLGFVTLHRKKLSGVEFDSSTRNPPIFHPESRKSLRGRLAIWLEDDTQLIKGAFYVSGPACVGKTALMQAISVDCNQRGWVGATLFLSHVNRFDDNSRIIATIASQLAQRSQAFTTAMSERLRNDPKLFERDLALQFQKLIVDPAKIFRPRIPLKKSKPLIIILDGLDQCMNQSSQVQLLALIDDYVRKPDNKCPFKWLISGRPVARWLEIIARSDNQHVEISLDGEEAVEDVKEHIIRAGFRDICKQYPDSFEGSGSGNEEWPTEAQRTKLAKAASGFFMFGSCMLRFIADQTRRDPKGQLIRCLEFLEDPSSQRENNPLSPLYLVYQQILSDIDPNTLSMTTSVLQILAAESGNGAFHAQSVAESLNMDVPLLYRALDGLQSVIRVSPTISLASTLEFYHPSFFDFLRYRVDPSRTKSLSHMREVSAGRTTDENSNLGLAILLPIAMVQADFDSPSRYPPPRCNKGTRTLLRQKTSIWLTDADCHEHILWITGPAGVGKTAIAQSLAEHCHQTARLGASLFFSHSIKGNENAQRVVPTLACQLATKFPDYNALITPGLLADPAISEKEIRVQFQELIADPFEELQKEQRLYSPQNPLVIILDGLEACGSRAAQTELTRLISEFSKHKFAASGLFWVICSRPESYVKKIIWRMTVRSLCRHEQLLIEDAEAKDDVELVFRDGFHEIRKRYYFRFGPTETWPTDIHWHFLKDASSGFLKFASCILQYVGDEDQRDPRALLDLCLGFVQSSLVPHTLHPFHSLDNLYEQILLSVPPEILPTTLRILSLCVHASIRGLLSRDAMTFLDIDQFTFYNALDNLHSLVDFSSSGTDEERIHFFHHSFPDFLKDPKRSGQIAREINMDAAEVESSEEAQPKASSSKMTLEKGKNKVPQVARLSLEFPASGSGSKLED